MTWLLQISLLLVVPMGARNLALKIFSSRLKGERSFILFVLILGMAAWMCATFDPRLTPEALGIRPGKSWILSYAAGLCFGTASTLLLVKGFLGSLPARPRPMTMIRSLQWFFVAVVVGLVEEYYFRGVWGSLGRGLFGAARGALMANLIYALLFSSPTSFFRLPLRGRACQLLVIGTLFSFGLSLSWVYAASGSLALPAGLHAAAYYVIHRWSRPRRDLSTRGLGFWMGREDPALGLGPIAVYWGMGFASLLVIRWAA